MTADGFRMRLAALSLTQSAFARIARVEVRTVQRWIAGDRHIPGMVETILDLLAGQSVTDYRRPRPRAAVRRQ